MLHYLDLDMSLHLLNFTTSCFAVYVWSQEAWSTSVGARVILFEEVSLTLSGMKRDIVSVAWKVIAQI